MNTLVIDASIAIKWVVEEDRTSEALVLRQKAKLIAPDLLVAECANIFWKKVQRGELLKAEALFAARLLQGAEIELLPTRGLCLKPRHECRSRSTIPLMIACILSLLLRKNASLLRQTNAFCVSCIRADNVHFVAERFR